jgi:hypothetical protein
MPLDWTQGNLRDGMRCFAGGEFFEAHEHWELVWLAATEPEKTFLQALIQVSASFHHFQQSNMVGTVSLLRRGLRRLERYPEEFGGIAVAPLREAIREWIKALEADPQNSPPPFPSIAMVKAD